MEGGLEEGGWQWALKEGVAPVFSLPAFWENLIEVCVSVLVPARGPWCHLSELVSVPGQRPERYVQMFSFQALLTTPPPPPGIRESLRSTRGGNKEPQHRAVSASLVSCQGLKAWSTALSCAAELHSCLAAPWCCTRTASIRKAPVYLIMALLALAVPLRRALRRIGGGPGNEAVDVPPSPCHFSTRDPREFKLEPAEELLSILHSGCSLLDDLSFSCTGSTQLHMMV